MKLSAWCAVFLIYSSSVICEKKTKNEELYNLVLSKPGNISITGIFNALESENCNFDTFKGLEEMASMIWVIETLNKFNYLPAIEIGFRLYETCLKSAEDQNHFWKVLKTNAHEKNDILDIGTVTTVEFYTGVNPMQEIMQIKHVVHNEMFVQLVVQLLTNLQWVTVDSIITDSENILDLFNEKTTEEEICVHFEYLLNSSERLYNFNEVYDSGVIVIIAAYYRIFQLTQEEDMKNESLKIILVPTDLIFHPIKDLSGSSIVLLPLIGDKNILTQFVRGESKHKDFFNHKEPTKSPLFIGVAVSILKLLKPLKNIQSNLCKNRNLNSEESCVKFKEFLNFSRENKTFSLPLQSYEVSPNDIENVLKILKIEFGSNDEMFLYIASLANGNTNEDAGIFQIFNPKAKNFKPILIMINDNLLNDQKMEQKSEKKFEQSVEKDFDVVGGEFHQQKAKMKISLIELLQKILHKSLESDKKEERQTKQKNYSAKNITEFCDSYLNYSKAKICENFAKSQSRNPKNETKLNLNAFILWRHSVWVIINTCLGIFDLVFIIFALIFIINRICKKNTYEGSQYFIILIMLSSIFIVVLSVFYHLEMSFLSSICDLKLNGPPLVYALLFSLLLSRSLMLATSENGSGFASHINGYLQSILFIFIFGIQVSVSSQQWFYEKNSGESKCFGLFLEHKIIYALSYEFLLLGLLLCICPLIMRSKRNHREGFLFFIAIISITLLWCCWLTFFFLLPKKEKDAAVAIGLNATAAALVTCVFIPKIYFMISHDVRNKASHSLPTLDLNLSSSETLNKSNQGINALCFGSVTYRNSRLAISNPNFYGHGSSGTPQENATD